MSQFRRFVFESSFLDTYELDERLVEKIRENDVELMLFSFDYLAHTLFGAQIPEIKIKDEKIKEKVAQIKQRQDEAVLSAVQDYEEMKKGRGGR